MELVQILQSPQALTRLHTGGNVRSPIGKTSAPGARQHDNLGLLHSFGGEVFDDLTDDRGSHESILS